MLVFRLSACTLAPTNDVRTRTRRAAHCDRATGQPGPAARSGSFAKPARVVCLGVWLPGICLQGLLQSWLRSSDACSGDSRGDLGMVRSCTGHVPWGLCRWGLSGRGAGDDSGGSKLAWCRARSSAAAPVGLGGALAIWGGCAKPDCVQLVAILVRAWCCVCCKW